MPGGGVAPIVITGTTDMSHLEAPITIRAYLICAFAAFGGIFFGYDTGWMGGVLAMPYFIRQYTGLPYPDPNDTAAVSAFHLPASDQSLTTSILSCGTFFGAIIAGDVADFIGRRTTIITGCMIFIVGCILETASTGLGLMCAGRIICGAGVGFISAIVILYMSVSNIPTTSRLSYHAKDSDISVGNRTKSRPWCCRGGISILYHYRYPLSQLCCLRNSKPKRYWLLPNPNRRSVPLGHHPSHWSLHPPGITTILCQKGQAGGCRQGSVKSSRATNRLRLYPG